MVFSLLILFFLIASIDGFRVMQTNARGVFTLKAQKEDKALDLTGHALWVKFDGFGVVNSNFAMELQSKFAVKYSRGVSADSPGFWRVVKYDDGREQVEATHPLVPEYMFFFDIEETQILWRGDIDMNTRRVTNGVCVTNKKRFGIFPYSETIATWEADVLLPDESLPDIDLPLLSEQNFIPPDDFVSPLDMDRYPEHFSPKFQRWFFAVEEALTKGTTPPPRPQPFFTPKRRNDGNSQDSNDDDDKDDDIAASRKEIKALRGVSKGRSRGF